MKKIPFLCLICALLSSDITAKSAESFAPEEATYIIAVTLNGKPLAGMQQAAFSGAPFAPPTIKPGIQNKIAISVTTKGGKPQDITRSPAVSIADENSCLVVKDGTLTAQTMGKNYSCVAANLYVTYTVPGSAHQIVSNIFFIQIANDSPLTSALQPPVPGSSPSGD